MSPWECDHQIVRATKYSHHDVAPGAFNRPTTWAQIHKHHEIILPYVESRLIFHIRFQIAEASPAEDKMAGNIDSIVGCN